MALQKTVNKELAVGMAGEFYDDSPRRVTTYKGFGVKPVKATGTLTASSTGAANNDTVTIGYQTYTFKTSPANAYEVAVGDTVAASLANLADAINGDLEGTPKNVFVTATSTSTTVVLTAIEAGTGANSVPTTETGTNLAFGGATLSGGVDAVNATIGVAYTSLTAADEAGVGGSGVFLGIAVNPKEYATYNNFNATMEVPNGIGVQLCTFGRIFVRVVGNVSIGQAAFFNTSTGEIKGAAAGTDLSGSGFTEIKNSKFIVKAALATEIAVLELGN